MSASNGTFSVVSHSPASSKDKKGTYYSISLNGYARSWTKHVAPMTASQLASEFERANIDTLVEKIKARNEFTPTDAVSEALGEAFKSQGYNAPDNY